MAQLANILARITLYELLKLSKGTREALKEELADAEVFIIQIPPSAAQEEMERLHISQRPPSITFSPEKYANLVKTRQEFVLH